MPNYIKNRIQFTGDTKLISELEEAFSTFYPEEQHTAFDGSLTFQNESGNVGWLNQNTGVFVRRDQEDVIGIPEGYTPLKEKAWTRFPDFNKIIPMPESLNITSDSWIMPLENRFSSEEKLKYHLDKMREHFNKHPDSITETIENFTAGVKNYILYGHATWYTWSIANWGTKWNSSECVKISNDTFEFITAWSGIESLICEISKKYPEIKILYKYADEVGGSNCGIFEYYNGNETSSVKPKSLTKEAYEISFDLRPERREDYVFDGENYSYLEEAE